MRYTEARLTEVATLLLEGIDEDAVDFRPTYDEEDEEPVVLPGAFPNLLANGSSGIAVGMATNIPPHNVAELCDAALHLIKFPNATDRKAGRYGAGAGFPDRRHPGRDRASITEAYTTGRGAFRVRARWEKEDTGRGGYQIVVTEIPYQVQKSRLIEKIAELLIDSKLPLLDDVRDESAEDVRVVLEPKSRTVDPEVLMESLFKLTELESRIPAQHERAVRRQGAEGACRCARCCANGSSTARRCWCGARNYRLGADRAPAGSARRLT